MRETINAHVFIIDEYQAFNSWQKNIKQINLLKFNPFSIFANRKKKIFRLYLIDSLFQPQFTYPHSVGDLVIHTLRVFLFSALSCAAMTIELQCRSSREQFSKNINIKHKIVCVKNLRSNIELRSPFPMWNYIFTYVLSSLLLWFSHLRFYSYLQSFLFWWNLK